MNIVFQAPPTKEFNISYTKKTASKKNKRNQYFKVQQKKIQKAKNPINLMFNISRRLLKNFSKIDGKS
jgi:hypothetical protein